MNLAPGMGEPSMWTPLDMGDNILEYSHGILETIDPKGKRSFSQQYERKDNMGYDDAIQHYMKKTC